MSFLLREKYKLSETQEQSEKRIGALKKLIAVSSEWATSVAKRKGASDEELKQPLLKIKVFGSYMLDVHFPDTDIDVILVFRSKFVTQSDFFTDFVKKIQLLDIFTNICEVESARVPIIKFSLFDVQFDVLFAAVDDLRHLKKFIKQDHHNDDWRRLSEAS